MTGITSPLWVRVSQDRFLRHNWCEVAYVREGLFGGYWTALVPISRDNPGRYMLVQDDKVIRFCSAIDAMEAIEDYLEYQQLAST